MSSRRPRGTTAIAEADLERYSEQSVHFHSRGVPELLDDVMRAVWPGRVHCGRRLRRWTSTLGPQRNRASPDRQPGDRCRCSPDSPAPLPSTDGIPGRHRGWPSHPRAGQRHHRCRVEHHGDRAYPEQFWACPRTGTHHPPWRDALLNHGHSKTWCVVLPQSAGRTTRARPDPLAGISLASRRDRPGGDRRPHHQGAAPLPPSLPIAHPFVHWVNARRPIRDAQRLFLKPSTAWLERIALPIPRYRAIEIVAQRMAAASALTYASPQ